MKIQPTHIGPPLFNGQNPLSGNFSRINPTPSDQEETTHGAVNDTSAEKALEKDSKSASKPFRKSQGAAAPLTDSEKRLLTQLQAADTEVRNHEMAHIAAAGGLAISGANFTYTRGPDGMNYAVGGEVSIDTAPVPGDPQATVQKMHQVRMAALAPTNPSPQDLKVASSAASLATKAQSEFMSLKAKEMAGADEKQTSKDPRAASDSYIKVKTLPEKDPHTFQLAV